MVYVNIITQLPYHCYVYDNKGFSVDGDFVFFENSSEDRIWDIVVVYEGIFKNISVRVKKKGLWFISGEPPLYREYPSKFLDQFDYILTSHKYSKRSNVINWQQSLDWHFCKNFHNHSHQYSLKELESFPIPKKSKIISVITSGKDNLPGHLMRLNIIRILKEYFSSEIDFYGGDDISLEYKSEAILPYKFHICIENSSINDYWTEKLADSLLGYSIPVYAGCHNIDEYFDEAGMIRFDVNKPKQLIEIVRNILENSNTIYNSKFVLMVNNRKKLFTDYHLFKNIQNQYKIIIQQKIDEGVKDVMLRKLEDYPSFRIICYKLKLKCYIYKKYQKIKLGLCFFK